MALPWFLNPWAEVRQLRKYAELWMVDAGAIMAAWVGETEKVQRLENENTVLRQRIAEMEKQKKKPDWITPAKPETARARVNEIFLKTPCGCQGCVDLRPGLPGPGKPGWRYACEKCGNKRCPHHEWHQFKCTGSNEPDQIGEKE